LIAASGSPGERRLPDTTISGVEVWGCAASFGGAPTAVPAGVDTDWSDAIEPPSNGRAIVVVGVHVNIITAANAAALIITLVGCLWG
jgi:hypothetical protein